MYKRQKLGGDDRDIAEAAPSQQATDLLNRIHAVGFNSQARPPDLAKGYGASTTQVLEFLSRKAMDTITIQKPDYSQVDKVEDASADESDGDIQEDCGSYVEDDVLEEDYVVAEDSKFCEVDENEDRAILQARTSVNEWRSSWRGWAPGCRVERKRRTRGGDACARRR